MENLWRFILRFFRGHAESQWRKAPPERGLTLPRLAGVTIDRYLLFGANTPWERVRLTCGLEAIGSTLEMKSSSPNRTSVVPLLQGVSTHGGPGIAGK